MDYKQKHKNTDKEIHPGTGYRHMGFNMVVFILHVE